ncbi:MAG: hypothetical protein M3Z57_07435, partial [Candidatus Dormibacteraeota bacterium]|nr:hypothetical protein [Candidatus Dormibacteraeota bacterium]
MRRRPALRLVVRGIVGATIGVAMALVAAHTGPAGSTHSDPNASVLAHSALVDTAVPPDPNAVPSDTPAPTPDPTPPPPAPTPDPTPPPPAPTP